MSSGYGSVEKRGNYPLHNVSLLLSTRQKRTAYNFVIIFFKEGNVARIFIRTKELLTGGYILNRRCCFSFSSILFISTSSGIGEFNIYTHTPFHSAYLFPLCKNRRNNFLFSGFHGQNIFQLVFHQHYQPGHRPLIFIVLTYYATF